MPVTGTPIKTLDVRFTGMDNNNMLACFEWFKTGSAC